MIEKALGALIILYVIVSVLGIVQQGWFYLIGPAFLCAFMYVRWRERRRL